MRRASEVLKVAVSKGALIFDQQSGTLSLPYHAELIKRADGAGVLYWVQAWAEDQHHTHERIFDAAVVLDDYGLMLLLDGNFVVCIAPFIKWSEEKAAERARELMSFLQALDRSPADAARFADFVDANRPN